MARSRMCVRMHTHARTHKQTKTTDKMKCLDCKLKYVRETGRMLNTRYKEYIQAIRNNHSNSRYSNHILNTGHKYNTIADTVDILRTGKKGKHLNTSERHHMHACLPARPPTYLSIYRSMALQSFVGPWPLFSFLIFYTVGKTPWTRDQPITRPIPAHTGQHKHSIKSQAGFEPTIPVFERAKTVHALDRAATVISKQHVPPPQLYINGPNNTTDHRTLLHSCACMHTHTHHCKTLNCT
jgi:hypothetical protein